jgi:hypothetical protein
MYIIYTFIYVPRTIYVYIHGRNHIYIYIYIRLYMAFLAGKSPNIRSYTACIHGSGQLYQRQRLCPARRGHICAKKRVRSKKRVSQKKCVSPARRGHICAKNDVAKEWRGQRMKWPKNDERMTWPARRGHICVKKLVIYNCGMRQPPFK